MRFLMTFESNPKAAPPTPEKLVELGDFTRRMMESGKVVLTGGLVRPSHGIKVLSDAGKVTFTDGPFVESKELIDGFAVVEAPDLEGAKQLCREFMAVAGDGKGEILAMFSPAT